MKQPTLLSTLALGAWCALLTAQAQPAAPANRPAGQAEASSEPADEILPLVQFEDAPLVDVIKTLARQAHLNIIIDPRIMAAGQTGKSRHVSIRLENTTAQKVLETVLNNNNLRLERDPRTKTSRVALKDPATEGHEIESMPPVVVKTLPVSGVKDVTPGPAEIKVTFSKEMADNSWSWSSAWQGSTPETLGKPAFEADRKTCVLQVKLEPNKTYAWWLNSEQFKNFKDQQGHPAVPYLLVFQTAGQTAANRKSDVANAEARLNEDQGLVLAWTDRQFRSFFDARSFDGWAEKERPSTETIGLK